MAHSQKPTPVPDAASSRYWQAARDGRLEVQRCEACNFHQFPPDVICRRCQMEELRFEQVSGAATLYTYAVYTRAFTDSFAVPYVLALVDLKEHPDVRIMANVIGVPVELLQVGMDLELTFEARGAWRIPQFQAKGRLP